MSSTRQTVMRGPSFTGFGNRPLLMPAHQVERPTEKAGFTEMIGTCVRPIADAKA